MYTAYLITFQYTDKLHLIKSTGDNLYLCSIYIISIPVYIYTLHQGQSNSSAAGGIRHVQTPVFLLEGQIVYREASE